MDSLTYNEWRRDIAAEYGLRTGRAYPKVGTKPRRMLSRFLVELSDEKLPPDPGTVVDLLIREDILKG